MEHIRRQTKSPQGLCTLCLEKPQAKKGNGFRSICWNCFRRKYKKKTHLYGKESKWRKHIKDKCEKCGFVPEHICQLDVDHIDQNKSNNDPCNLMTLCANCHRLKTWKERQPAA